MVPWINKWSHGSNWSSICCAFPSKLILLNQLHLKWMSKKSQEGLPFCKKLDERSKKYSKYDDNSQQTRALFESPSNKRRNASGPKKQLKPQRDRRKEKKRPNAENSRIEFRGRLMAAEATFWHSTRGGRGCQERFLASLLFDAETNLDPGKQTFIQRHQPSETLWPALFDIHWGLAY